MDEETQQIFKEQLGKLPTKVVDFLSSADWDSNLDEIGSLYNLTKENLSGFKREATLVLAGLAHPDEFGDNLEKEAGIRGTVRDAIVTAVEQRIFAPIRGALVDFLSQEGAEDIKTEKLDKESVAQRTVAPESPTRIMERMPDIAPDNLPTGETEPLIPPIPPKTAGDSTEPAHPFEEKMKRVFTAGQQSMGELTLEPAAPPTPPTARLAHDPYREPIE